MQTLHRIVPVLVFLLLGAAAADDSSSKQPSDGFVSLFDGKTLDHWIVTDCKVEVKDGAIVIEDGLGFVRSDKIYGDFILEIDWKNLKQTKYDSGIYFRSDLPQGKNHWP